MRQLPLKAEVKPWSFRAAAPRFRDGKFCYSEAPGERKAFLHGGSCCSCGSACETYGGTAASDSLAHAQSRDRDARQSVCEGMRIAAVKLG